MKEEKINCWEFKECGLEPNGKNVLEQGVCPVAIESSLNGVHGGKNGGRCCWLIKYYYSNSGTLLGSTACIMTECKTCNFYRCVSKCTDLIVVPDS